MERNDDTERIHRYLRNTMGNAEKIAFEAQMTAEPALAAAVKVERKLLAGIQLVGDEDLRKNIQIAQTQFFSQGHGRSNGPAGKPTIIAMRKIISIAAAAIVLLGLAWWGFFRQSPLPAPNGDALFASYFKPEATKVREILLSLENSGMAGAMDAQDTLREALKLYEQGSYLEATTTLDTFLVHHPANDTAMFYLGVAHMNESRFERAIEILEPISANEQSGFRLDAQWYLGLCYFKVDGGFAKAEEIFHEIAVNAASKDQQAAKEILQLIGH